MESRKIKVTSAYLILKTVAHLFPEADMRETRNSGGGVIFSLLPEAGEEAAMLWLNVCPEDGTINFELSGWVEGGKYAGYAGVLEAQLTLYKEKIYTHIVKMTQTLKLYGPIPDEPPCRMLPREKWCDRNGPADFMGHTCGNGKR